MRHDRPKGCQKCGAPKVPGQGQRYCADCKELADWERDRKRKTRVVRDRQPCMICGGVKEPGHGRKFCERCIEQRRHKWVCRGCGVPVPYLRQRCDACKAESRARWAKRAVERHRLYRATHPAPKRKPLTDAQKQDRRMEYRRIKGETGGRRHLSEELYVQRYGNGKSKGNSLPTGPLLSLCDRLDEDALRRICAQLNINFRRLRREPRISLANADRLCVELGTTLTLVYGGAA